MSILIRNVQLNGKTTDLAIEKNRISKIAPGIQGSFDTVIDGSHHAVLPPFYNTHGHAAMTLLRGLADDMELFEWLTKHIWPVEAVLTKEDIYWGSKLACMEMIRSGTVFFNDMYFMQEETIRAAEETGMRAAIGLTVLVVNPERAKAIDNNNAAVLEMLPDLSPRIQLAWAPHAVYSVNEDRLCKVAQDAEKDGLRIHIHLAETEQEVHDCMKEHACTPVEYIDRLGLLSPRTVAAHSIHLSDSDIELIRKSGTVLSHVPCSNYKLSSGKFRFHKMLESGIPVTLGTDGCASNNNLSLFDTMKTGAFGAIIEYNGPTGCDSNAMFRAATENGARAFGIDAGVIEEGKLADMMLVDLDSTFMVADHNLISNMVYSADSSCVSTVICDGRILMRDRVIPGMQETIENARRCARNAAARAQKK